MNETILPVILYFLYFLPMAIALICYSAGLIAEMLSEDGSITRGDLLDAALWTFCPGINILSAIVGPKFIWEEIQRNRVTFPRT